MKAVGPRLAAACRRFLEEPPPPPAPGANLDPAFRRRWLWFWLPLTFVAFWLLTFLVGFNWQTVGIDARIYHAGSAAWLNGGDPWSAGSYLNGRWFSYAGLPPTVVFLAPLALLPEEAFVWLWLGLSLLAAVVAVRALRLPLLWLAYPPLLYGVIAANPHVVLLALLLAGGRAAAGAAAGGAAAGRAAAGRAAAGRAAGVATRATRATRAAGSIAGALAVVVKIVAIPPLIGERRWRALLIAAGLIGLSLVVNLGLWESFVNHAGSVQESIHSESGGGVSAWGQPPLMAATIAALIVLAWIDLPAAGWLAVPALFPTTQYYYAMFALPVDPFLAAGSAFPLPGVPAYLTIAYAAVRLVNFLRAEKRGPLMGDAPSGGPT